MKKIISMLLCVITLFTFTTSAFATGSGNIDGGGGNMGDGNSQSYWNTNNEGVRVTVVRASDHAQVTTPIDFVNSGADINRSTVYHFGKVSKISYNNGAGLTPHQGNYVSYSTAIAIPTIISDGTGNNNIEAIKRYFCSEYVIMRIAEITGMNYDILIGGEYKLLLEPIACYKFNGVTLLTTATESALYDAQIGGDLRSAMGNLTHKNLPLAMFLEVSDLGYPAWSGSSSNYVSNAQIKSSLGLGIVRFEEETESLPSTSYDYEYRTNTEVITSVFVSGGQSDPDNNTSVIFNINGTNYTVRNVYYPKYDSQIVWVKWTTPAEPQDMTITVRTQGEGKAEQSTINVKVVDMDENPPPNPVADDRNNAFVMESIPDRDTKTSNTWSVWRPWWQANWEWESDWKWISNMVWIPQDCTSYCPSDCSGGHGHWTDAGSWKDNGKWVDNGWWGAIC